jgi:hypothetical protein
MTATKMTRLLLALAALALVTTSAGAAPSKPVVAGGCRVHAQASIAPGLTLTAQDFTYHYTGKLTGCAYTRKSAPTSGVITAGETIRIKGKTYQEPTPTANGTCLTTTSSGYDFARWSDGTQTVVMFTTASGDGATHLTGSVVPSMVLKTVDGTSSTTFRTTRFADQVVVGRLIFAARDPSLCTTTGLTSAGITGLLGHVGDRNL